MNIKFSSRQMEKSSGSTTTTIAWNGTRQEMTDLLNGEAVGTLGEYGKLRSVRMFQESANVWCCEKQYSTDSFGNVPSEKPFTAYGKKSATLKGSMLSMPLESHPDYKTCWNYFLAASPDESSVPSWWGSAKDTILSGDDSQKYIWVKSPGEVPSDSKGRWRIIKDPLKPGTDNYDVAVYSVTETAKYSSSNAAGNAVAGKLNKIGSPGTRFGISGGNWKCDDASVFYDGENWFATCTWTLSGNAKGWDKDLYD